MMRQASQQEAAAHEQAAKLNLETAQTLRLAADWVLHAARLRTTPAVVMRPSLTEVEDTHGGGSLWVAEYGSLMGIGKTPEESLEDFNDTWRNGFWQGGPDNDDSDSPDDDDSDSPDDDDSDGPNVFLIAGRLCELFGKAS